MAVVHPEFAQQGSFAHLRLGKLPPKDDPRTLKLAKYLDDAVALPAIPASFDFSMKVSNFPMYGNDRLGDCTIAAAGHMIQAWNAAALRFTPPPTETAIETAYWETGSPPSPVGHAGGRTDNGRDEISVLNYWRHQGIGGDRIGAYVSVDPTNHAHMKAAIYLFGGVYTGIELPLSAQHQTKWSVVPGPTGRAGSWGGHAVPYLAYSSSTFKCVTWGATLKLTLGFNDAYTEEAYAIISPDFVNSAGLSPAGFNLAELQADLAAL